MNRGLHVGIHASLNRNAGDTLLFDEVRNLFDHELGAQSWSRRQLWDQLDAATAARLRDDVDYAVVGGGGLLLRDQAGADIGLSGWQWNSSVDAMQSFSVPLIVFAIGYNRFRDQADFDPVFTEHMNAMVDRATFVGLRNRGTIEAVRRYLTPELHDRLVLQQCPTCVLWQLHDEVPAAVEGHAAKGLRLLRFNVAFDRPQHRFGPDPDLVLGRLARSVAHAADTGWEILVTCHKDLDLQILPYLDGAGVPYEVDDLTGAEPEQIIEAYSECDLAMGLRGHAQMIPFGLRVPILSIVSHDKMAWFLDDIDHPEWGVEVTDDRLVDNVCDLIDWHRENPATVRADLAAAQNLVWDRTRRNMARIGELLGQTTHTETPASDGCDDALTTAAG